MSFIESERALVGACLLSPKDTQEWVCSELTPDDFHDIDSGSLYKALQSILDEGLEVSPISVKERSRVKQSAVQACLEAGREVVPNQLKTFIKDIRNASHLRKLSAAFHEAVGQCKQGTNADQILAGLESKLYGQLGAGLLQGGQDAHSVCNKVLKDLQDKMAGKADTEISTGLTLLDRALAGLRPKLYVVGARPSMGKSAFAETVCINVLRQHPYGVLVFSAEMDAEEIVERAISAESGVNVRKVMTGRDISPAEYEAIVAAAKAFPEHKWKVIDKPCNISTIRRISRIEANKMARHGIKLGLVVVDYIQLFADGESREQAVSAVSRGCKLMASELQVPVMALSQLNRSLEHREDKRPCMADLRESGAIEQDSDVIMFVYRPHQYTPEIPETETELIIAKQRGGPTGSIPLHFNPKLTLFTDVSTRISGPLPSLHTGTQADVPGSRSDTQNGGPSKPAQDQPEHECGPHQQAPPREDQAGLHQAVG